MDKMNERSKWKNRNSDRYRQLDTEIRNECKQQKEKWLKEKCMQIEEASSTNTKQMCETIKEIIGKKRPFRGEIIKDENRNILTEIQEILSRWRGCLEGLFEDVRDDPPEWSIDVQGPEILKEEIEEATTHMKREKAEGSDEVVLEMLDAAGEFGLEKMTRLTNSVYDTGQILEKMRERMYMSIPKKPGTIKCEKHRVISVMSQMSKIILRVIMMRMRRRILENVEEEQYGFRKRKCTRNAMFVLRTIIERAVGMQKDVYLCFIDVQKTFKTVRHTQLVDMLKEIGIDGKDLRVVTNLYWNQKAAAVRGERSAN